MRFILYTYKCFTWLVLQSEDLSALRGQTTAVVHVCHWNIPQAKQRIDGNQGWHGLCSCHLCVCVFGNVTHLELCTALSEVSRKCSCVRSTWSPLRLTVTNGKPFCDVHELIISDTFRCCGDTSTWGQKEKSSESAQTTAMLKGIVTE